MKKEFASALLSIHTQPPMTRGLRPISKILSALGRELETRLFERLSNKVRLSDAGEALLDRTQRILRGVESAGRKMAETTELGKENNES